MSELTQGELFDRSVESTASTLRIDDGTPDGRNLTSAEVERLKSRLRHENFDSYARTFTTENPADLARAGNIGSGGRPVYVVYSGTGAGLGVGQPARVYIDEMRTSGLRAGTIGDTPFGVALQQDIDDGNFQAQIDALNDEFDGKLRFRGASISHGTVGDFLWNFGSQDYIKNGKANGAGYFRGFFTPDLSPVRGFGAIEIANLESEVLNGERIRAGFSIDDALKQYDTFARAESAHKYLYRGQLYVDRQMLEPVLESEEFRRHVAQSRIAAQDLVGDDGDARRALSQADLERGYVRTFRTVAAKMRQYGEYADTRARLIVQAANDMGDRAPDFVRHGLRKVRQYYTNPNGGINRTRVATSLAAGALAVGNLWVEYDRRKDTPGAFEQYIRSVAEDATSLTSLAFAGGIMAAAATPLGPVVLFTLGAVATYAAIKNIVDYLASPEYGLDPNGYTYKIVKHISDSLNAFEEQIKNYLEAAADEIKEIAEKTLELFTGRAIEWVSEEAAGIVGEGNDILVGDDVSVLIGDEQENWLVHRSAGQVYGDKGDDVLVGWLPEVIKKGEAIGGYNTAQGYVSARQIREGERAAAAQKKEWQRTGDPRGNDPLPPPDPNAVRAEDDLILKLDGGEGNDWVITILGEEPKEKDAPGTTTIGGLGRDWVWNTSPNGIIWGDVENSIKNTATGDFFYYETLTNEEGEEERVRRDIKDDKTNSDNFWYWADTTVMDAGHADVLKYFGIPMTGGDANGGLAGYAIYAGLFGSAIGMGNYARYVSGAANGWQDEIYVDHIQPWILYGFKADEDGNLDLYVTNAFEQLFRGLMAALDLTGGESNEAIHKGWMKIENVDVVGSRLGALQFEAANTVLSNGKKGGSLNMVFRALNPLQMLAPLIREFVPGAIGSALYYSIMADSIASTLAAMERFAESMDWSKHEDPLVIDLDGDGIETVGLENSKAYFDVDGDMFRERTGWLRGDDGFLVLDANGNGRVDNIAELFGDRFQGGYAELAAHDSNADGKITAADLVWGSLQVWQDRDRDGETDAGELKTLDQLGIVELSLGATPLDATTPQGARLLARGDVAFADGRLTSMFEAIFTANEVDTKYAGESGLAPWQPNTTLNAKGFGTITDMAVAMANDPANDNPGFDGALAA